MAQIAGSYSPTVQLGTTWNESLENIVKATGAELDLTGCDVRAQLRDSKMPLIDALVGAPDPILEITTPGYYSSMPAWPVIEAFSLPTPTNGTIILAAPPASYSGIVSPTNARVKLYWAVWTVNKVSSVVKPVVAGKVLFLSAGNL